VKRHVLGKKHDTSLHMSRNKKRSILSIPPSKIGAEGRWQAIYERLFVIAEEACRSLPSPYHDGNTRGTIGPSTHVPVVPPSLVTPILGLPAPLLMVPGPIINPDASAYLSEAQLLTETYHHRRVEVQLRVAQEQANLQAIQTFLQGLDFEARQLEAALRYNLSCLWAGYDQGLSLATLLQQTPLLTTARTEMRSTSASDTPPEIPAPFETSIQGLLEFDNGQPRFEAQFTSAEGQSSVADDSGYGASVEAQSSVANDSGYGTMSSGEPCPCDNDSPSQCFSCSLLNLPED
jgi:hypothetical protein